MYNNLWRHVVQHMQHINMQHFSDRFDLSSILSTGKLHKTKLLTFYVITFITKLNSQTEHNALDLINIIIFNQVFLASEITNCCFSIFLLQYILLRRRCMNRLITTDVEFKQQTRGSHQTTSSDSKHVTWRITLKSTYSISLRDALLKAT